MPVQKEEVKVEIKNEMEKTACKTFISKTGAKEEMCQTVKASAPELTDPTCTLECVDKRRRLENTRRLEDKVDLKTTAKSLEKAGTKIDKVALQAKVTKGVTPAKIQNIATKKGMTNVKVGTTKVETPTTSPKTVSVPKTMAPTPKPPQGTQATTEIVSGKLSIETSDCSALQGDTAKTALKKAVAEMGLGDEKKSDKVGVTVGCPRRLAGFDPRRLADVAATISHTTKVEAGTKIISKYVKSNLQASPTNWKDKLNKKLKDAGSKATVSKVTSVSTPSVVQWQESADLAGPTAMNILVGLLVFLTA